MKQLDMNVLKGIAGGDSGFCQSSRDFFDANNKLLYTVTVYEYAPVGSNCTFFYELFDDDFFAGYASGYALLTDLVNATEANPSGYVSKIGINTVNSAPAEVQI